MQRIVTTTLKAKRQRSRILLSPDAPRKHSVPSPDDPDRAKLIAIVEERGPPIDRVNGMQADRRWSARALAYIEAEHTGYILKHVRALGARHIPEEDLVQAAKIGALRALETFDLDKAGRFLTHGKWWIRCETGKLVNRTESLVIVPPDVRRERERLLRDCPSDMSDEDAALAVDLPVDRVRELRSLHLGHEHRQITRSAGVRRSLAQVAASAEDRRDALRQQIAVGDSLSRVSPLGRRVLFESLGALDMLADDPEALRVRPPSSKQARRFVLEGVLDTLRQELAEVAPQSRRGKRATASPSSTPLTAEGLSHALASMPSDACITPTHVIVHPSWPVEELPPEAEIVLIPMGSATVDSVAGENAPEPPREAFGPTSMLPAGKPTLRSLAGLPRRNAGVAAETVAAAETTAPSSSTPLRSLRALPSRQHTRLF
jgi:hypothetical protein